MDLDEHLFRREFGRLVSALTHLFGIHNLALAEDVVQDAFCRALEVWKFQGVPQNPSAWLMATAKNRARDVLRREKTARTFAPELGRLLESEWTMAPMVNECFDSSKITDSQLQMMFSCCHPRLPEEAQVPLILHILCGFSVNEIAGAFLSSHAAIEKRITRSKKMLAGSKKLFEFTDKDLAGRLLVVLKALYLLFNEGYHGASPEKVVRTELCREAMRLTALLHEQPLTATPATCALSALMCFDAARLPSRLDAAGDLNTLFVQDRSQWDKRLIAEGQAFLDRSGVGSDLTEYHIEAAIACLHTTAPRVEDTDWGQIVELYDQLATIRPSPVVRLNRAIAIAQLHGPQRGLQEMESIPDVDRLSAYPFHAATLGELELRCGRRDKARSHFERAAELSRNEMERVFFRRRAGEAG